MENLHWPAPIIIGLIALFTGFFVFVKDASRRLNRLFFAETLIIFVWAVANSMVMVNWHDPNRTVFWDYATYATGFLIAPCFAVFSSYLPKEEPPKKWLVVLSLVTSIAIIYVLYFTKIVRGVVGGPHVENKVFLSAYCVCFLLFALYGLHNIHSKIKHTRNPLNRKQLVILYVGLVAAFTVGVLSGIFTPLVSSSTWVMNLFTVFAALIFSIFAGFAVIKYGFMAPLRFAMKEIFRGFFTGIMITDYDHMIVKSNPALSNMLNVNWTIKETSVNDFADAISSRVRIEAERKLFRDWFCDVGDGEKEVEFAEPSRVILISKSTIRDSRGYALGRIYMFLDNTERRRLTRQLQEGRDYLEGLLTNANEIIITCDKAGKIMSANKMAVKISGIADGEWQRRNIFDIIAPEFRERVQGWAEDWVLGNKTAYVMQLEFVNSAGERIPVETSLNIVESNGEVIGVQAIARDLRPRLEAEQQIRKLEALNEQIIRNAPIGIATVDRNGIFTTVNPAFAQIIGFDSPGELLAKNFFEFPGVKKFHLGEGLQKVLGGETFEQSYEFRTVIKDKEVNIKAFGAPLVGENEEVQGALIIAADLSREKELERQLVQSEKLSSIGRLISGVAHELNNPLTAIMGYSQLLSITKGIPAKSLDMSEKIQANAERCKKIVENLLGFARRKPPQKCEININDLLDRTIQLREYDLRVSNIHVRRRYQTKMRSTAGDPDQLQQVFLNLINNAFDAMYEANGKGVLEVRTYESPDNFINVEFVDNGPGVKESVRDKIFDPFVTTKSVGKGTGLGLSLSYGIIHAHNGSIALDNRYLGGAKFHVRIPIETIQHETAPECVSPAEASAADSKHVLLIDDEEQILECTKLLLENHSYQVTTAGSGDRAKTILNVRNFDVIITDLKMPGTLDGKALYNFIQAEKPELKPRVIFITGDTLDAETDKFLSNIPNRHVKKPFTSQELIDCINAVMGK